MENAIYEAMDEWLEEYTIHLASDEKTQEDPVAMALEAVRGQLAGLQLQQETFVNIWKKVCIPSLCLQSAILL